ncbi:hypothetical protein LENED_000790 [Lentinula edodes]|uniref:Uncharacterized protein n=1 Tax=Lentinula edodes TaxID=5353 RepID=A0A1Q3DWN4_LENED|nr:hypothetical protein LENED_000790 [Lentinula edodes]
MDRLLSHVLSLSLDDAGSLEKKLSDEDLRAYRKQAKFVKRGNRLSNIRKHRHHFQTSTQAMRIKVYGSVT